MKKQYLSQLKVENEIGTVIESFILIKSIKYSKNNNYIVIWKDIERNIELYSKIYLPEDIEKIELNDFVYIKWELVNDSKYWLY